MERDNKPEITDQAVAESICKDLPYGVKDAIYRMLWAEHVEEDVRMRITDRLQQLCDDENMHIHGLYADVAAQCADRYCYCGDYDCNRCYWDNLDELIDDEIDLEDETEQTEIAVKTERDQYVMIQRVFSDDDDYDYSVYGSDYKLIDGGQYSGYNNILHALCSILNELQAEECTFVDYEELSEKAA